MNDNTFYSLSDLINEYNNNLLNSCEGYGKREIKVFEEKVRRLRSKDVEKEIIEYINGNLVTKKWENAQQWIGSILTHPSTNYIEPLMKILREQDSNAPHYWALDVIEYMPESMVEQVLPELKKLVIPFNPSWLKEIIEKYFETIVFNDEGAEDFISTLVDSSNEMVKYRAKYWMETFEVERREDAEED